MALRKVLPMSGRVATVVTFWSTAAFPAPITTAFTYQGQLKSNGAPVNDVVSMTFRLFEEPAGGTSASELISNSHVEVVNGLFTVDLDFGSVPFSGSERYLEVAIDGTVLSPRQRIAPVPYALRSLNAAAVEESNWQNNGDNVFLTSGNAGIGTDQPQAMLHLQRPLAKTSLRFQTVRFAEGPPASSVKTPGAAAASGAGQVWTSPNSARVSDDIRATASFSATTGTPDADTTQPLTLSNCGFSIPPQAQVVGIQVSVEGQGSCNCTNCDRCTISVGTELLGGSGPAVMPAITLAPSDGVVPFGGTFERWGLDWTAAAVNSASFGPRLAASLALLNTFICIPGFGCSYSPCDCTGSGSIGIDAVTVTVFFYDVSVTSTPVDWSFGIPETSSAIQLSTQADLSNPAVYVDAMNHVGINTTNPGTFQLAVVGFAAKTTGTSWSALSDARLKRNVEPVTNALERLLSLRGVTFEFTDEGISTGLASKGRHTGFIAQQVEQVFPEWVGESNGYKFITEDGTSALLVEALRELRREKDAQIRELVDRIERLERERVNNPVAP